MKPFLLFLLAGLLLFACQSSGQERTKSDSPATLPLFDGQTFSGWEGDTANWWRIEDQTIIGGSLEKWVPHNDFLVTNATYGNFVLQLEFKLSSTEGFANAGVQFHSQRMRDPAHEMIGYQADIGPGYYGVLYDESRRKKVLAGPDSVAQLATARPDDWNQYELRAKDGHIQLFLNGTQTVDYQEPDPSIPQSGHIGLQVHGGGKVEIAFRNIRLEEG